MNPLRMAAVTCVTVALVLYTIGTVRIQRARRAITGARAFLTAGVALDVVATTLMVLASARGLTLHGVLGYSALALMAADVALIWRHWRRHRDRETPRALHLYSRWAYLYWVAAYFTGAALVMASRAASR
jgi:hypothetical protein